MRRSSSLFVLACLAGMEPVALAEETRFYFSPRYFGAQVSGEMRLPTEAGGDLLDFDETLDIDPSEGTFEAEGFWRFNRFRLDFGYTRLEVLGEEVPTEFLFIEGEEYFPAPSPPLTTNLETQRAWLAFGYDFMDGAKLSLGPVIGMHYLGTEARFKQQPFNEEQVEYVSAFTPVLGGDLGFHPGHGVMIHARAFGTYRQNEHLIDAAISIEYMFSRVVGLSGGYLFSSFDWTDVKEDDSRRDDERLEMIQQGWFAGLSVHL